MKFVVKHRTDILQALSKHQMEVSQVSFVKRRGRIMVNHVLTGQSFSYLRKKETTLDPVDKQWKHAEWFKIKSNDSKETDVTNWEQVMLAFDQWLVNI